MIRKQWSLPIRKHFQYSVVVFFKFFKALFVWAATAKWNIYPIQLMEAFHTISKDMNPELNRDVDVNISGETKWTWLTNPWLCRNATPPGVHHLHTSPRSVRQTLTKLHLGMRVTTLSHSHLWPKRFQRMFRLGWICLNLLIDCLRPLLLHSVTFWREWVQNVNLKQVNGIILKEIKFIVCFCF